MGGTSAKGQADTRTIVSSHPAIAVRTLDSTQLLTHCCRRISQVEKKIDGLVANLVASREPTTQRPAPVTPANPGTNFNAANTFASRSERSLAPGSWLRVPDSFEPQRVSPREGSEEEDDSEEHRDGYLDRLGEVQNLISNDTPPNNSSDHGSHTSQPDGRSSSTRLKAREPPLKDDEVVQGLISSGEADTMVQEYATMVAHFPFVPLLPDVTAQDLSKSRPMLLLAVLTICSFRQPKLQRQLDEKYRVELANRTVVRPKRSMSLLQSMLVYLGW